MSNSQHPAERFALALFLIAVAAVIQWCFFRGSLAWLSPTGDSTASIVCAIALPLAGSAAARIGNRSFTGLTLVGVVAVTFLGLWGLGVRADMWDGSHAWQRDRFWLDVVFPFFSWGVGWGVSKPTRSPGEQFIVESQVPVVAKRARKPPVRVKARGAA